MTSVAISASKIFVEELGKQKAAWEKFSGRFASATSPDEMMHALSRADDMMTAACRIDVCMAVLNVLGDSGLNDARAYILDQLARNSMTAANNSTSAMANMEKATTIAAWSWAHGQLAYVPK